MQGVRSFIRKFTKFSKKKFCAKHNVPYSCNRIQYEIAKKEKLQSDHFKVNSVWFHPEPAWCLWLTDLCERQCGEKSHRPEGSVPLTSTEAPHPPPAHTGPESVDL